MNVEQDSSRPYAIELPGGGWRVTGSRVSLDSVIYAYRDGESPEQISRNLPSLSPEHVYGAIAFYLHNQTVIDRYLEEQVERWDRLRLEAAERNSALRERVLARRQSLTPSGTSP